MHTLLLCLSLLIPAISASPLPNLAERPVYFLLAGDSTTAPNGGWGDGFLSTAVAPESSGKNYGHSGATTASFRAGGDWGRLVKDIGSNKGKFDVIVTIQVRLSFLMISEYGRKDM